MNMLTDRNLRIVADHDAGLSLRTIGTKWGLSGERVRIIVRDVGWAQEQRRRSDRFSERQSLRRNAPVLEALADLS